MFLALVTVVVGKTQTFPGKTRPTRLLTTEGNLTDQNRDCIRVQLDDERVFIGVTNNKSVGTGSLIGAGKTPKQHIPQKPNQHSVKKLKAEEWRRASGRVIVPCQQGGWVIVPSLSIFYCKLGEGPFKPSKFYLSQTCEEFCFLSVMSPHLLEQILLYVTTPQHIFLATCSF